MATFLVAGNWALTPNHGTSPVGQLVPRVHAPASLAKTNAIGTACATILGVVAVTKRAARVLRRAKRPINARDGKTIPQGAFIGWTVGWDVSLISDFF